MNQLPRSRSSTSTSARGRPCRRPRDRSSRSSQRRQVARLAVLLVERGAARDLCLIERRKHRRPFWRRQSLQRTRTRQQFFERPKPLDVDRVFELARRPDHKLHHRADAQRFADVADQRIGDRRVVLHPVEPRRVPDLRESGRAPSTPCSWRRFSCRRRTPGCRCGRAHPCA